MNRRSLQLIVGLIAVALLGTAIGQAQEPPLPKLPSSPSQVVNVAGIYECHGISPEGKAYHGIVEIDKHGDTYLLRWTLGRSVELGLGLVKDDFLAVSYFDTTIGVVLYKIEDGSRLVGDWTTIELEGQVYSEVLTKLPDGATKPSLPEPKETAPKEEPNPLLKAA